MNSSRFAPAPTLIASVSIGALALGMQIDQASAISLDFSNFSGQPDDGTGVIYANVGVDRGTSLDLVVSAVTPYTPGVAGRSANGAINLGASSDGSLSVVSNTTFRFQFVESGTTNPFTVSSFSLGLPSLIEATLFSPATYTLAAGTKIMDTPSPDGLLLTNDGTFFGATSDSASLSAEQERSAVIFDFTDTAQFDLAVDGSSGATYLFDDDLIFDEATPITIRAFNSEPQSVPEPPFVFGSGLVLGLGALLKRRYKAQMRSAR
jgi:hypothetical protein